MADHGFDNMMNSFECGSKVSYDFCTEPTGPCTGGLGNTGAGHIRAPACGHAGSLSRLILRPYDATVRGAVTMFKDSHCNGDAGRFLVPTEPTSRAEYTTAMMEENNTENDSVTSIAVPQGYSI